VVGSRVARWNIFIPKIPIWAYVFRRALECNILVYFNCHLECYINAQLEYFMAIWYILSYFGIVHEENSGNLVGEWFLRVAQHADRAEIAFAKSKSHFFAHV
jgi:hypothetical protein